MGQRFSEPTDSRSLRLASKSVVFAR